MGSIAEQTVVDGGDLNDRSRFYLGASLATSPVRIGDHFGTDHGRDRLDCQLVNYLESGLAILRRSGSQRGEG